MGCARPCEKTFRRKVDADRYARNVATDIDRGTYLDPRDGQITVSDWVEQHEATKAHRRRTTEARDRSLLATHVLPTFGRRRLNTVQPVEIRSWIANLVARGLAPDTVRKCHQLLAGAFNAAVEDGLIARSPSRRVDLPNSERADKRFLAPTEIDQLATAIDPRYRTLVLMAAHTGLRLGELAALRVDHIDMLRRRLRVEETLTEHNGDLAFGPPKTAAARRTVALPRFLIDELAAHLAAYPGTDGLVFTSTTGGPLRRTNFRRRVWLPAVTASVGQPMRFHDLRHTHVAMLINQGQHPKVIAGRLGHTSVRTVLDVYGHLYDGLDEAAADALDEAHRDRHVGSSWG